MRTINHMTYTPAPDIVHEAAGHSPIIVDELYSKYLQNYGRAASKAISSKEDYAIYMSIRFLSDIKENPQSTKDDICKICDFLDLFNFLMSIDLFSLLYLEKNQNIKDILLKDLGMQDHRYQDNPHTLEESQKITYNLKDAHRSPLFSYGRKEHR